MDIVSDIREFLNAKFPTLRIDVIARNPKLGSIDVILMPSTIHTPQEVLSALQAQFINKMLLNWDVLESPHANIIRLWFSKTVL